MFLTLWCAISSMRPVVVARISTIRYNPDCGACNGNCGESAAASP
jgi:hypothetical protein